MAELDLNWREATDLGGKIVTVASDAGRVGSMGETCHAGTKDAIIAFTKSLAREMARQRINCNVVCPGPTDTPLFHSIGTLSQQHHAKRKVSAIGLGAKQRDARRPGVSRVRRGSNVPR